MAKEFREDGYSTKENEPVYSGIHSKIESVTMTKGGHSLDLLRKKIIGYSAEFMEGPKWHSYLQSKGYRVFPTLRYDIENKIEYMTDLRLGGTHRVIDFCGDIENSDNFSPVYISNLDELEKEVEDLLNKSKGDGLLINEPNIFFDIEISSGVAHVMLGDLRELGYELDDFGIAPTKDEIFGHNSKILKEHMDRLKKLVTTDKTEVA